MTDINIYDIPIYYIGFDINPKLEKNFKKYGFTNINHFSAIDGRKYNPKDLLEDNIITIRTYNDLVYGRSRISGMPTLGGIGCTLSHLEIWKYMVDKDLPYIIIAEDDARFSKHLSQHDKDNITNSLNLKNGGFISTYNLKKHNEYFFGTHFYIITNDCAKELVKYALPIDVQTDSYINNLNNRGKINLNGYVIASQILHKSSIQSNINCIKCILPSNPLFYISIVLIIFCLIILYIFTTSKLLQTKGKLITCENRCPLYII